MLEFKPLDRRQNAASQVHQGLRELIVSGQLMTGTLLSEPKLAQSFGVSRTPVREALKKLSEEALVDIYPQIGSVVAPIDIDIVQDIQFIRETLELRTVELACEFASPHDLDLLNTLLIQQRALVAVGDRRAFMSADDAFHDQMMRIAGRPTAWRIVSQSSAHLDRVRFLSLAEMDWLAMVFEEHVAIVDAIKARNVGAAVSCLRDHLRSVLAAIVRATENHPRYFARDGSWTHFITNKPA